MLSNSGAITSLGQLKTHFGVAVWAQSFVREQSFVDSITTPGTLWRWKEDPDGVINRTKGWNPSMTSITNAEWNKNSYDSEDGKTGVSLYNYATFQDYPVRHKMIFTATIGGYIGAAPLTAFVSQGVPDHSTNFFTGLDAGIALGLYSVAGAGPDILTDLNNYDTSGGWGVSAPHFKYPLGRFVFRVRVSRATPTLVPFFDPNFTDQKTTKMELTLRTARLI